MPAPPPLDVLIIGGGIAGLWTLDALGEAGYAALLVESTGLGTGQTLASQGIIHGGLKYTLSGLLHPAAEAISGMPERWRESLRGARRPDLRSVRVASPATWLWRSATLSSKLAMVGARVGLRTTPVEVGRDERPEALAQAPGAVYRIDEPVLDTVSLCAALRATHEGRLLHGTVASIERACETYRVNVSDLVIEARAVVLAAGAGNAALREKQPMQRRPLHMTLVRGGLPELFGHCVDKASTRVTISTHRDARGRNVWQLGGQLAEDGVALESSALMAKARDELRAVLPGVDLSGVEWSTYRIDRAERATSSGVRPDDAQCLVENQLLTVWPTKLALAPRVADLVIAALKEANIEPSGAVSRDGQRPPIGVPPWESATWSARP